MKRKGFTAVVESGSCDETYTYWEERLSCGHLHKTQEAATKCGAKHYGSKYVRGSWQASAAWHGYKVHDQDGRRPGDIVMRQLQNAQMAELREVAASHGFRS